MIAVDDTVRKDNVQMIFLNNDYSLGACPKVLNALIETNMELADGYCEDNYCYEAQDFIRELVGCPNADVHFIPGGTLANLSNMSAVCKGRSGVSFHLIQDTSASTKQVQSKRRATR